MLNAPKPAPVRVAPTPEEPFAYTNDGNAPVVAYLQASLKFCPSTAASTYAVVAIFVELSDGVWVVVVGLAGRLMLFAIDVVLPTDITGPERFALVVTLPAVRPEAVPVMFVPTRADGVPKSGVVRDGDVASTTVEPEPVVVAPAIAVPLPARTGALMDVERVMAGVVLAFATVPAIPLAETTLTLVTVPVPGEAGVAHFVPVVCVESAVSTWPFVPTASA